MTTNGTATLPTITYGSHTVDFAKAPPASIAAILQRGTAHYLGNEQAAKVSTWKLKTATEAYNALRAGDSSLPELAKEPTKEEKAALVKAHGPGEAEINTYTLDLVATAIADIYAGEVGQGGVRLDPTERELRGLIDAHIANTLNASGITFPKNRRLPTADEIVTFAGGETRTLEQMRENTMKAHGDRLRKDAEKRVADLAKKAEAAKAKAAAIAEKGPVSAAELGL